MCACVCDSNIDLFEIWCQCETEAKQRGPTREEEREKNIYDEIINKKRLSYNNQMQVLKRTLTLANWHIHFTIQSISNAESNCEHRKL